MTKKRRGKEEEEAIGIVCYLAGGRSRVPVVAPKNKFYGRVMNLRWMPQLEPAISCTAGSQTAPVSYCSLFGLFSVLLYILLRVLRGHFSSCLLIVSPSFCPGRPSP